jgi:hypothetical protein
MDKLSRIVLLGVAIVTLVSVVTWLATGGDWYTKYQIVEQVEVEADPTDPLAQAGFYEGDTTTTTVVRDEFRFGLLPTPTGLVDKHALSVASVAGPLWLAGLVVIWYQRRRSKQGQNR